MARVGGSGSAMAWRLPSGAAPRGLAGVAGPRALALLVGARRTPSRPPRGVSLRRRLQLHPGPPCLGQRDGDRLLHRPGTVLALADVLDLLADELAGLSGRGLPLALRLAGPLDRCLSWHVRPPVEPWNQSLPRCPALGETSILRPRARRI